MLNLELYVILGKEYRRGRSLEEIATALARGGVTAIQLRDKDVSVRQFLKDAEEIKEVTSKFNIPFIVNDRTDICLAVDADGVHLGKEDLPIYHARRILDNKKIIGASVSSIEEAKKAEEYGASYVSVGSVFPSQTKPKPCISLDLIGNIKKEVSIPVIAIGGITIDNASKVIEAGADGICIMKGLLDTYGIMERVKAFKKLIDKLEKNRGVICANLP